MVAVEVLAALVQAVAEEVVGMDLRSVPRTLQEEEVPQVSGVEEAQAA
jgi:hypothetical protein